MEVAKLNLVVAQEVETYFMEIDGPKNSNVDPIDWWSLNHTRYPNVAHIARKWLSISGTSTLSEQVFSMCGVVDTTK